MCAHSSLIFRNLIILQTWAICRTNAYGLVILVTVSKPCLISIYLLRKMAKETLQAADIPVTWLITKTTLGPLATPM